MKKGITRLGVLGFFVSLTFCACGQQDPANKTDSTNISFSNIEVMTDSNDWNDLTPEEARVIVNKGTEMSWVGEYVDNHEDGTYICRRCNAPLFNSNAKFDSRSGWPAFDDCVEGSVTEIVDADGYRTEIVCSNCKGHLGHVFKGENFTDKNTRHCVNSISMKFITEEK